MIACTSFYLDKYEVVGKKNYVSMAVIQNAGFAFFDQPFPCVTNSS